MSNRPPASYAVPVHARSEHPRLTPHGRNAEVAAIMSKFVPEMASQRFGQGYMTNNRRDRPLMTPDMGLLQRISDLTANDVSDAHSIFQLLPETELAMQILVSSILAPKDLVTTSVTFSLDANRFNSELAGQMLSVITEHFEKIYKISDLLKPCLQDALFLTGSYPLLILPESTIDKAINNPGRVSLESLKDDFTHDGTVRNLGFLGNSTEAPEGAVRNRLNFGLENFDNIQQYKAEITSKCVDLDPMMEVIDNPNVLKMASLQRRISQDKVRHLLGRRHMTGLKSTGLKVSQEAYTTATRAGMGAPYGTNFSYQPIQLLSPAHDLSRPTIGHPLVMKLPSESVIPVHQPGNPEKHMGYFLMLDALGNPLNSAQQRDYYADMANSLNPNSSMGSQLLQQAKRGFEGQATDRQAEIDEMARIYGQFLEKEWTDRLRNGVYGNQVEMSVPQEFWRVMFARAMAQQQTQVLYVPAEMLTYVAFDYNKYGIGQSLLQASKILGGIRVLSLFAETMADIKNAINRTKLVIQLEPEDPNPTHTVEFLIGEYAKTRQGAFPLGATNPTDLISYLQNSSVDIEVSGNTRYPETKMEIVERASNRVKPDTTMTKDLRDRHLMAMGLSPDMVDAGRGAEFATSVLANNLLLAKRVLTYQQQLEGFLRDFVMKYILADGYLMEDLRKLIKENRTKLTREQQKAQELSEAAAEQKQALKGPTVSSESYATLEAINEQLEGLEEMNQDAVIMEFLQCVLINLPKPDMATIHSQMEAFQQQDEAYDKALDVAYINEAYLESHGLGALKDLVAPAKMAIKAELMRSWMRSNNVMPELNDLLSGDDDNRPDIFKNITEHVKSMGDSLLKVMYQFARQRQMIDPAVQRLAKIVGEDTGDSFGGGGDDFGGGDAFSAPEADGGGMMDIPDIPTSDDPTAASDDDAGEVTETAEDTTTTTDDEETTTTQSKYGSSGTL